MDKDKLQIYKARLINERNRIQRAIEGIMEHGQGFSQRDELEELSMIDNHSGDIGTEMYDKVRRFALLNNEESILEQINNALNRIESGKYGICELCGREISEERLNFLPYATTCIECEEKKADYNTYRYDRPVEEETLPPFGRAFRDYTEEDEYEVEYNMEDSWQDVAKYEKRRGIIRNFDDQDDEEFPDSDPEGEEGIVEFTDKISNQQYKNQLP
ncbi:TraR/DksA C4-type zinc finger protein [Fonticella tunisiensis]|uniref:TraR/DksA family transcriptional regulator n=1 Tax=Fonticella tunisiensis TaxID=1096341 RepID=A0A4R7KUM6_9CLOT|nr:TraR/DksA C4-type zinc finger protein [Fonticella tunisiensis]TDT61830.1 TraR/DksA family transcriptional regulator [Fonticella tunisiensis]